MNKTAQKKIEKLAEMIRTFVENHYGIARPDGNFFNYELPTTCGPLHITLCPGIADTIFMRWEQAEKTSHPTGKFNIHTSGMKPGEMFAEFVAIVEPYLLVPKHPQE